MIGLFLPPMALDVSKIKYSLKLIEIFDKTEYKGKVVVFVYKKYIDFIQPDVKNIEVVAYGYTFIFKLLIKILKIIGVDIIKSDFNKAIKKNKITFGIFPTPNIDIKKCNIPYAASFQSLGHRLNPELQDTAGDGLWEYREDLYSIVCKGASLIFIDSEVGKDYLKFYYEPKGEIIVIPHEVPTELNINVSTSRQKELLNKHKVTKKFLFYPAQFWPHKNHIRIFEAVKYLKKDGIDIQVVFTGSSNTISEKYCIKKRLKRIAHDWHISNDLIITGYLTAEEIFTFYKNAAAMIMPQLIPEPCIPYIESMGLGCPVIGSDIPGIKEQIDGCGILVNPYNVESIANGIRSLFCVEKPCSNYIQMGFENRNRIIFSKISVSSLVRDKIQEILRNLS